jgi:hypothetical protein
MRTLSNTLGIMLASAIIGYMCGLFVCIWLDDTQAKPVIPTPEITQKVSFDEYMDKDHTFMLVTDSKSYHKVDLGTDKEIDSLKCVRYHEAKQMDAEIKRLNIPCNENH